MSSSRRVSNSSATRYPPDPRPQDYASDRSPLQKLEVTLDSISKEEKRARVEEAEHQAQQRLAAKRGLNSTGSQYRDGRTRTSNPNPEKRSVPLEDTSRSRSNRLSSGRPNYPPEPDYRPTYRAPPEPTYVPTNRQSLDYPSTSRGQPNAIPPRNTQSDVPPASIPVQEQHRRSGSGARVLTKPPPPDVAGTGGVSTGEPIRGASLRDSLGRRVQLDPRHADQQPDSIPNRSGPPRRAPDDSALARGPSLPARAPPDVLQQPAPQRNHRLPNVFHRHQQAPTTTDAATVEPAEARHHSHNPFHHEDDGLRRYQPARYRDYTKEVRVARLALNDNAPAPPNNQAWWEKSSGSVNKRRNSTGTGAENMNMDGGYDTGTTGQTFFQPPMYLKCGPLLRFTGIRRDPRRLDRAPSGQSDRELWTGSIMIVTVNSKSSNERPPTLRIFKQLIDLLPPPPAEIDLASGQHLPPEYVDPVAGQVKMSRVGKTLYVRPVDALDEHRDLSRVEDDTGLFEETKSVAYNNGNSAAPPAASSTGKGGERRGRFQETPAYVLHQERGVTFWKFNLEIELGDRQTRIAYRINKGPAMGFWVPAKGETMNIMFHSCNGFSLSVDPNAFSGPDPLWRDVLNTHQTRPFHVMIGGGDQIYNDAATIQCDYFRQWAQTRNPIKKNNEPFSVEMENELEEFYLNRYAMWFSQGLFGMANSQIPMVNMWDDHDIMDGFGSYPDSTMSCPVMSGVGQVAFKYYMLFQHQALPIEDERTEPSWLLGSTPGPYIGNISCSVFMFLGRNVALLGLDCRTERARGEILSQDTWDLVFTRCRREIVKGDTKHLIVLLGVPIAYPRLNFLENALTSRLMDPVKALGRTGMLGGFVNKFDGGVEILDDLDDHWTAKHHKDERNWFIQELQELAAEKSVRITILGGDVHLCAIGQFYTAQRLRVPKDQDHRYMPNVISSAIVNTPPSDMVADVLNKRNKVHHLDHATDEDMIAMFPEDVNHKPRNNHHLLPRRNWCSIREYIPAATPPHTPSTPESPTMSPPMSRPPVSRALSLTRGGSFAPRNLMRRLSKSGRRNSVSEDRLPPGSVESQQQQDYFNHRDSQQASAHVSTDNSGAPQRPNPFLRRTTGLTATHEVDLSRGLDIRLNVENVQGDPAGTTSEYRLLVPALDYQGAADINTGGKPKGRMRTFFETLTERGQATPPTSPPMSRDHSVTSGTMTSDGKGGARRDSMSPPERPLNQPVPGPSSVPNTGAPTRNLSTRGGPPPSQGAAYPRRGPSQRSSLPPDAGYARAAHSSAPLRSSLPPGVAKGSQPPPGVVQRTAFPPEKTVFPPEGIGWGRVGARRASGDGGVRRGSVDMNNRRRSGGHL